MSIRTQAVKGVAWSSVGTIGAGLLNFILTMILARFLDPADFGLLELLAIFTILSEAVIDSGFSQAIIRDKTATDKDLSSVFFLNILIGLVLYAALFACAPLIAGFYNEPKLIDVSRFAFLVLIFNSGTIVQNANYSRNLDFKRPAIASVLAICISGTLSVYMAFNDYGVWALATNMVAYAGLKMLFFWVFSRWKPILAFSRQSLRKYFAFGGFLLIQGLVDKFVSNLESLLIGKVYTKAQLGYFSQARKLDSYIAQTTTSVIQRVTYPLLAKINNGTQELKSGYRRILKITMFAMVPLMLFSVASADSMIFTFFGPKWAKTVPYFQIWCLCGLLVSFYSIFINLIMVKGKSKNLLMISLVRQAARVLVIVLLLNIGIMQMLYGILAVTLLSAMVYSVYSMHLIGYRIRELAADMLPIVATALVAGTVTFFLPKVLNLETSIPLFFGQMAVMATIYLLLNALTKNATFLEVKDIFGSMIKRKKVDSL